MDPRRRALSAASLGLVAAAPLSRAFAQPAPYPSHSVTMIVPFTAGGTTDILARLMAQQLSMRWNQPVVVENRGGAGGNIGAQAVAVAAPDGYTLCVGTIGTHAINAGLYKKMPYDTQKDFVPISRIATVPNLLVVTPSLPVNSVKELIDYLRANPNKVSYASSGNGTSIHLSGELFKRMTNTEMQHVPYRGSAQAIADLLAGQVQVMFDNAPSSLPSVKAGTLRPLAVTTLQRSPALPNVPTLDESGVKGFEMGSWFGVFAPANTPAAVVKKIDDDMLAILALPEVRKKIEEQAAEPHPETPEEFKAFVAAENRKWGEFTRSLNITLD
ncbi:tripartite tricarboxylate transporter substrate binding protein [soil metagenome]